MILNIIKYILEKLRNTNRRSSRAEKSFFGNFRDSFAHILKPEPKSDNDKPALRLVDSKEDAQKTSPERKHLERQERRKKRQNEKRKYKAEKNRKNTNRHGLRILDDADMLMEFTGEEGTGYLEPEDEVSAIMEKGDSDSELLESKHKINRQINQLVERETLSVDLHGESSSDVAWRINDLINTGKRLGKKYILVITGKGKNSRNGEAVLRPIAHKQLSDHQKKGNIRSFQFAPSHLGGHGAFVVVLK